MPAYHLLTSVPQQPNLLPDPGCDPFREVFAISVDLAVLPDAEEDRFSGIHFSQRIFGENEILMKIPSHCHAQGVRLLNCSICQGNGPAPNPLSFIDCVTFLHASPQNDHIIGVVPVMELPLIDADLLRIRKEPVEEGVKAVPLIIV